MNTAELRAVPGVAECTLSDSLLAELPAEAPPAPWDVDCTSIIWYARGNRAATEAAGPAADGGRAVAVIGGLVTYSRTPVGAYREVFGAVGLRRGRSVRGTIPFMAVDSRDSLVGGRQNWSLPKCLARFAGDLGDDFGGGGPVTAQGDDWQVQATARPFGPSFPLRMGGRVVQSWPDGRVRTAVLRGKARGRSALVRVEVASTGTLAEWLRPGRHLGVVLRDVTFTLPAPS